MPGEGTILTGDSPESARQRKDVTKGKDAHLAMWDGKKAGLWEWKGLLQGRSPA